MSVICGCTRCIWDAIHQGYEIKHILCVFSTEEGIEKEALAKKTLFSRIFIT
jgi:hypothetical protein